MKIWTWEDDIHFVDMQLDHYYGFDNWPRRYCAEIVNISISTHKRHSRQEWLLTTDETDYITSLLDYSNHEIKKLTWDGDKYKYFAGSNGIIKKEIPEDLSETKIQQTFNTTNEILQINTHYKPNYNYNYSDEGGLYMFASIVSPINRPGEQYYLIKIGQSTNLQNRINSYKSMNPFASIIDIKVLIPNNQKYNRNGPNALPNGQLTIKGQYQAILNKEETYCHNFLSIIGGYSQANTEWYVVPKNIYKQFLQKGFDYIYN